MRLRESIQLDSIIKARRLALGSETDHEVADIKSRALVVLIEARDRLDAITGFVAQPVQQGGTRIKSRPSSGDFGDINVTLNSPTPPDPKDFAREVRQAIRKELRRK